MTEYSFWRPEYQDIFSPLTPRYGNRSTGGIRTDHANNISGNPEISGYPFKNRTHPSNHFFYRVFPSTGTGLFR